VGDETKTGIFMMGESLISCPPQGGLVKRPHGYEGFTGERAKARSNCLTMSAKLITGSRRIPEIATRGSHVSHTPVMKDPTPPMFSSECPVDKHSHAVKIPKGGFGALSILSSHMILALSEGSRF